MNAYVLSLLAQSAGLVLSRQARIMERALSASIEEPVTLSFEFAKVTMIDKDGQHNFPVFLEADSDSIELYKRIGAEREPMLSCERSGQRFIVTGGSLVSELPENDDFR